MQQKSLFDQLSQVNRNLVAAVCNTTGDNSGFRTMLRDVPALAVPFTIGDAAKAYVAVLQKSLEEKPGIST